ncbi:MAG: cupredoxin domain-containing protein [Candidatus Aenigmarchaeota archaeon]|nr:cupredoxin domain-containing protein [Candidatus Aenigmarchaeota archaeon]
MKASILLISLVLLVAGCIQTQSSQPSPTQEPTQLPASPESTPSPTVTPSPTSAPTADLAPLREFKVTAKNWAFEPDTLEAVKGDRVRITITSLDDGIGSGHGFALPDFNVNKAFKKGETVQVEFVADKAGEFRFFCSVFCGSGHGTMAGKLVVKES